MDSPEFMLNKMIASLSHVIVFSFRCCVREPVSSVVTARVLLSCAVGF